jgi:hypothetical protein
MAKFKSKMRHLEPDWADRIWAAAQTCNRGTGASWLLPLAALAITGARPASLEQGIRFAAKRDGKGRIFVEAIVLGAKLLKHEDGTPRRGQKEVRLMWYIDPNADRPTHRPAEFDAIASALMRSPGREITAQYDAEAISTRLRDLSHKLWPRKRHHVSGICYRELFSSESKAAGMDSTDLAAAMAHLSTESQGRYAGACRRKGAKQPARRTFSSVTASTPVRTDRSPMVRFKRASAMKAKLKT